MTINGREARASRLHIRALHLAERFPVVILIIPLYRHNRFVDMLLIAFF
jgi:hypothetical protein